MPKPRGSPAKVQPCVSLVHLSQHPLPTGGGHSLRSTYMQIADILAEMGGWQSPARKLGIRESQAV